MTHPFILRRPPSAASNRAPIARNVQCKYCGNEQLVWQETASGYRLFSVDGERHVCDGMRKQTEYRRQKEVTDKVPVYQLVATIQEEFDKLLSGKDVWTREELAVLLERAKANAYLRYI